MFHLLHFFGSHDTDSVFKTFKFENILPLSNPKCNGSVGLRHRLGTYPAASYGGGLGSIPGQAMWNLWWTKWPWGGFSSSTLFPCQFSFHQLLDSH
jgi:hypothetical protein